MEPEIRYLGDLQRLELRPGDKLVLTVPGHISQEAFDQINKMLVEFFGDDVRVLILGEGMKLGAVAGALDAVPTE